MKNLHTSRSFRASIFAFFLLFFCSIGYSQEVVLYETSFDPKPGMETEVAFDINQMSSSGFLVGKFTPGMSYIEEDDGLAEGAFVDGPHYAIVSNPYELDPTTEGFIDLSADPDYMFAFSEPNTTGRYFSFRTEGLKPGTPITVEMELCYLNDPDAATPCYGFDPIFKVAINPNEGNVTAGDNVPGTSLAQGDCQTITVKSGITSDWSRSVQGDGIGTVYFNVANTMPTCAVVGIKSFKVIGTPEVKIAADQGTEVCVGDIVTLQANNIFDADYQWEVSLNGGISWEGFSTNQIAKYEITNNPNYTFRLTITTPDGDKIVSNDFSVATGATNCCDGGFSRQTVYLDDFGTVDLSNGSTFTWMDYSDIYNPVEKTISGLGYTYELESAPAGLDFVPAPSFNGVADGGYTVAANFNWQTLGWSSAIGGKSVENGGQNYDHSGAADGAAYFANPLDNTSGMILYEREIHNLCNKDLHFEAYVNKFSAANAAEIKAVIQDIDDAGNVLWSDEQPVIADGPGWEKIQVDFTLKGTGVYFKLVNNTDEGNGGNDLVLDDIKITTCGPPAIDIYFSKDSLSSSITPCADEVNLFPDYSATFPEYYNKFGGALYLFQWNTDPTLNDEWRNLGNPAAKEQYTFSDFQAYFAPMIDAGEIDESKPIYFRVIAATQTEFDDKSNFQGTGNDANFNNPCRDYSVSEPIQATLYCPTCVEPEITGLKVSSIEDTILCPSGRTSTLVTPVVGKPTQELIDYMYYVSNKKSFSALDAVSGGEGETGFDDLPVTFADLGTAGKYITIELWDRDMPEEARCRKRQQIFIEPKPEPTFVFDGGSTVCLGADSDPLTVEFTGDPDFSFELMEVRDVDGVVQSTSKKFTSSDLIFDVPLSSQVGEYEYTLLSLEDKYCVASDLTNAGQVVVEPIPEVALIEPTPVCEYEDAFIIEVDKTVTASTGDGVFSTDDDVNGALNATTGEFNPQKSGPGEFTIVYTYTETTGCSNQDEVTVVIYPKPDLELDLPESICYTDNVLQLQGAQNGTLLTGSEEWENNVPGGPDVSGGSFDPKEGDDGTQYTISYIFISDDGCRDTATDDITVHIIEKPTTTSASINIANLDQLEEMDAKGRDGATLRWYYDGGSTPVDEKINASDGFDDYLSQEAINENQGKDNIPNDIVYQYCVTQEIYGCVSECEPVTTTISNCPTPAPPIVHNRTCVGTTMPELKATGKGDGNIIWMLEDGTEIFKETDNATSSSFIPSDYFSTDVAGDMSFLVYEYNSTLDCYSPTSKVTMTIDPLPKPVFGLDQLDFCSTDGAITFSPQPTTGTGTYAGSSALAYSGSTATFTPNKIEQFNESRELTYTHKDANGCVDSVSVDVYVTYTDSVEPKGDMLLTTYTRLPQLTVEGVASGAEIHWYDSTKTEITEGKNKAAWNPVLPNGPGDYVEGDYTFYVSQEINGCEGPLSPVIIRIIDCPAPPPAPLDSSKCEDGTGGVIGALSTSVPPKHSMLGWFDSPSNIEWGNELEKGQVFGTEDIKSRKDPYVYYVSEWDEENQCYGPSTEVKLVIDSIPTVWFRPEGGKDTVCFNDDLIHFEVSHKAGLLLGSNRVSGYDFNPEVTATETFDLTFDYTSPQGCRNTTTRQLTVIHVDRPEIPQVTLLQDTSKSPLKIPDPLVAQGLDNACFRWYDENMNPLDESSCSDSYISDKRYEGSYTYYATQQEPESGCISDVGKGILNITYCPVPPPQIDDEEVCIIDQVSPTLTADAQSNDIYAADGDETIYWYANNTPVLTGYKKIGATYQYDGTIPSDYAERNMYARVFDPIENCYSPPAVGTMIFNKTEKPTPKAIDPICEGQEASRLTATGNGLEWYLDPAASDPFALDNNVPAPNDQVGTYEYYVRQTDPSTLCVSEMAKTPPYVIKPIPAAPILVDAVSCQEDPITPTIRVTSSVGTLTWTNAMGEEVPNLSGTNLILNESSLIVGSNLFFATPTLNGCPGPSGSATYTLKEKPEKPVVSDQNAICLGLDEIQPISRGLAPPNVITHWYIGADTSVFHTTGHELQLTEDEVSIGEFTITLVDELEGCRSNPGSLVLPIKSVPDASFLMDTIVCQYTTRQVTIQPKFPDQENVTFIIEDLRVGLNPVTNTGVEYPVFIYKPNVVGKDTVVMTATNGFCESKNIQPFYIVPKPNVLVDANSNFATGEVTFANGTTQDTVAELHKPSIEYWMEYGEDFTLRDSLYLFDKPFIKKYEYGEYNATLYAKDTFGCIGEYTVGFIMEIMKGLYIPTAFAPDAPANDEVRSFKPKGFNLEKYQITVYDTWGNIVFFSDKINEEDGSPLESWNGRDLEDNALKSDYYIWKVEATFKDHKQWKGKEDKFGKNKTFGQVFLVR